MKYIILLEAIVIVGLGFMVLNPPSVEPEIITMECKVDECPLATVETFIYEEVEVPVEKVVIKEVIKEVIREVPVEKTVYKDRIIYEQTDCSVPEEDYSSYIQRLNVIKERLLKDRDWAQLEKLVPELSVINSKIDDVYYIINKIQKKDLSEVDKILLDKVLDYSY